MTYKDRNLAEGLFGREVLLALVLIGSEVDGHNLERDLQFLQRRCNDLRAGRHDRSVDFENHGDGERWYCGVWRVTGFRRE